MSRSKAFQLALAGVVLLMWVSLGALAGSMHPPAGLDAYMSATAVATGVALIVLRDAAVELTSRIAPAWYQRAFPWQFQIWHHVSSGIAFILLGIAFPFIK